MKKIIKFLVFSVFLLLASSQLMAESVFMKSGVILEGKIIRETDAAITLKNSDGVTSRIPRKSIQRVLYHDDYKQAKYIGTKDNKIIRGYIVAENNAGYTVRKNLKSKVELVINKKDILYVSSKKLVLAKAEKKVPPVKKEVKKEEPEKPYVNPYYNNVRLGGRLHYYFGWNSLSGENKNIGHTGGFSFFLHWRSWECDFFLSPRYNEESFFAVTTSAGWVPVSFFRFRIGLTLGYSQFSDNLAYFDKNTQEKFYSVAEYKALTYGVLMHYAHWLRFSVSMGYMINARYVQRDAGVVPDEANFGVYNGNNGIPISCFEMQLELFIYKNYSIQIKYHFLQGDQNKDPSDPGDPDYRHNLSFVSLGFGYRFHL